MTKKYHGYADGLATVAYTFIMKQVAVGNLNAAITRFPTEVAPQLLDDLKVPLYVESGTLNILLDDTSANTEGLGTKTAWTDWHKQTSDRCREILTSYESVREALRNGLPTNCSWHMHRDSEYIVPVNSLHLFLDDVGESIQILIDGHDSRAYKRHILGVVKDGRYDADLGITEADLEDVTRFGDAFRLGLPRTSTLKPVST